MVEVMMVYLHKIPTTIGTQMVNLKSEVSHIIYKMIQVVISQLIQKLLN